MQNDICGDNRFKLIEKYKQQLLEATNIETNINEMNVIDNILFRFWQMGWLDKLEQEPCDDAISREAVREFVERIQTIKDSHNENGTPINYGTICDLIIQGWKLMKLPSVQPSLKGNWVKGISENGVTTALFCTEGGFENDRCEDYRFCPNCSVDMRGNTDAE